MLSIIQFVTSEVFVPGTCKSIAHPFGWWEVSDDPKESFNKIINAIAKKWSL